MECPGRPEETDDFSGIDPRRVSSGHPRFGEDTADAETTKRGIRPERAGGMLLVTGEILGDVVVQGLAR
jgi:hypothetical protein